MLPYYQIKLPLPTSINNAHTVGKGFFNPKTGKYSRVHVRSKENTAWRAAAALAYRNLYPRGVNKFLGRLRVDYIFVWHDKDRGRNSSDIGNREKVLSDFLEKKLFNDDNQIDEQHQYRRILPGGESYVLVRVYEIDDRRYNPIEDIFK